MTDSTGPTEPTAGSPATPSRPSLPDDHWRPAPVGTGIGLLLTVASCVALAGTSPLVRAAAASLVGGLLVGSVTLLFATDRSVLAARLGATILVLPAGSAVAVGVALAGSSATPASGLVLVAGIFVAGIGASTVWWTGLTPANGASALLGSVLVLFGVSIWVGIDLVLRLSPLAPAVDAVAAAIGVLVSPPPGSAVSGLGGVSAVAFLLAFAALSLSAVLRVLPLAELVAAPNRDAVADRLDRTVRSLGRTALVCVAAGVVFAGLAGGLTGAPATRWLPAAARGPLFALTGSATLRAFLLAVGCLGVLAAALAPAGRRVRRVDGEALATYGVPVAGGVALAGSALVVADPLASLLLAERFAAAPTVVSTLRQLLTQSALTPELLAAIGVIVVLVITPLTAAALVTLAFFVPTDAGSAALSSIGAFVASVGAGLLGATPVVVFAGLAASLVVWDVTRHAAVLGREVGRDAVLAHVETVHAAGSVLVAVCAVGLATLGLLAARLLPPVDGVTAVAALAGTVVGVGALLAAVRLA